MLSKFSLIFLSSKHLEKSCLIQKVVLAPSVNPGAHLGWEKILREIMQEKWKIAFENVLISEYTDFTSLST